jgi:hypothetical protein
MKRNGDWEYALGVNLMNQHLTYFTLAGARKYDYPPTFDYHEPWWNNYRYLNNHYARLSLALSSGRQINDILIIEPTTSSWLYDSYIQPNKKSEAIGQAFQTFITTLEKSQVEYDLGSENIIKDLGSVSGGTLIVGEAGYTRVVIPPMTENLDLSTFNLIQKFVSKGGTLIAFSIPELVDGSVSEALKQLFNNQNDNIIIIDRLNPEIIEKHFTNEGIQFRDVNGGTLYHHRRILEDGQLLFLINSNLAGELNGSLKVSGKSAIEMNTLTGEVYGYPCQAEGDNITLTYSIPAAGSLLLFVTDVQTDEKQVPAKAGSFTAINSTGDMKVSRNSDNALMIDFCDIEVGNEVTKDLNTYHAADKVFRFYGFKNGNPWNTSVQFRKNIVERDTFGIGSGFTATYHFAVKGNFDYSAFRAVVERTNLWSVIVNGTELKPEDGEWWLDRSFGVFKIGKLIRTGDNTISLKASPMKIHAEIEPVYILGNFSVSPATKGWTLEAPSAASATVSWRDAGSPFYSWGVSYSKEFNIDNSGGNWEIGLGRWNGTVAEVSVNGKNATVIAFPPYRSDITGLIKPGLNTVTVTVIGSLKNLLGPHHNNPKPGFVSPWTWRNVKAYPSGGDYRMVDYGLFEDFTLLHGVL